MRVGEVRTCTAKRSIAVVNLKGGSGKTTTAPCLAVGLARRKRRVLLIDGDPQANATLTMLNGQAADSPTLGQVLLDQAAAVEAIRPARLPRIDILPADRSAGRFRPVIDRATWTGTAIAIGPAPCRG